MNLTSRLAANYSGPVAGGAGSAIDPAIIGILFEFIRSFMEKCARPEDALRIAERRPFMARIMFRPHVDAELRAMKAEGTLTLNVDPARATKAIVESMPGTTMEELREIMS